MTRKSLLAALLTVVCCCSCTKEEQQASQLPVRTVLVYLGGDNSLSATLTAQVEALRAGWGRTAGHCLIYFDPADGPPRLLSLRGEEAYLETVAEYEEENSASAGVFARVIGDVAAACPAESYGLIFTSHASGWLPEGTLAQPTRSMGSDRHPGDTGGGVEMELADFAAAIPDGMFDFIVFEACLTAGVEVAYALRGKANYLLVSSAELLVPGFVPIYPSSLRYLFDTRATPAESLQAFAQSYGNYVLTRSGAYRSATLSIIRTAEMEALATLARGISLDFSTDELSALQHFDRPGSYGDNPASPRFFDFLACMRRAASPAQYAALEAQMANTVVWRFSTPTFMEGFNGFTIASHSGLTTYVEQACFESLNASYRQTDWYKSINAQ